MSNFPESFDNDSNLYLVHDFLRVRLSEDYEPGDTSIIIEGDQEVIDRFPPTGIITLTEQCSEVSVRALALSYSSRTTTTFDGLAVVEGFTDIAKPKRITNVTMNVFNKHHNELKDALIAIQTFVGIKDEVSDVPLEGTMEARINFLRKLVLKPKAWFTASRRIGVRPLCIEISDFSTRQPDVWLWDFGDSTVSTISRSLSIQTGTVSKCYFVPGIYDLTLTVQNEFGTDTVTLPDYITVRVEAPDAATISFDPVSPQFLVGDVLRSRANKLINILVDDDGEQSLDPITNYIWELNDDLTHENLSSTNASYGVGGIYDIKLKVETELGSYRTTTFEDKIDIVEKFNLWHFIFPSSSSDTTKTLYAYEFGLLSETYKAAMTSTALSVTRNAGFLTGVDEYDQQYREFRRNNGFTPRNLTASGDNGNSLVFWAEGASLTTTSQTIKFAQFNGFLGTWTTPSINGSGDTLTRYWNWLSLASTTSLYFLLGAPGPTPFSGSATNQDFKSVSLGNLSVSSLTFDYENGADELMTNVDSGTNGHFSVYRGAWRDSNGYFLRNDGTGNFFRIKSAYVTDGVPGDELNTVRKITDMPGATKFEGQIVNLSTGLFFFNNTGEVAYYNPIDNTWKIAGPGVNSTDFSKLQDKTVSGYESSANTLLAVSDGDRKAYLFYDYSTKAQLKFSEVDFTFTTLPQRPSGEQFIAGVY